MARQPGERHSTRVLRIQLGMVECQRNVDYALWACFGITSLFPEVPASSFRHHDPIQPEQTPDDTAGHPPFMVGVTLSGGVGNNGRAVRT